MPRQKTSICLLGAILVLLSACGAQSSGASPASTLQVPVTLRSADAWATHDQNYHVSVSVSCQPGEQMLGGGFSTSDVFEYAAFIDASYPSSGATWTVVGSSISTFQLSAEVYCAPATIPLGIQIAHSATSGAGAVACPKGTVLLGGGFQGGSASRPHGNGWESTNGQGYALCASQHVVGGAVVTSSFHAQSAPGTYEPGGGGVSCPAGQAATGGGFSEGGAVLDEGAEITGASLSGWRVTAGGNGDVTVYAVCRLFT